MILGVTVHTVSAVREQLRWSGREGMWLFSDETINGHGSENLKYFPRVTKVHVSSVFVWHHLRTVKPFLAAGPHRIRWERRGQKEVLLSRPAVPLLSRSSRVAIASAPGGLGFVLLGAVHLSPRLSLTRCQGPLLLEVPSAERTGSWLGHIHSAQDLLKKALRVPWEVGHYGSVWLAWSSGLLAALRPQGDRGVDGYWAHFAPSSPSGLSCAKALCLLVPL